MALWGVYALGVIALWLLVVFLLKTGPARSSPDARGIDQLARAGSDLTRAHVIEFRFYFPSRATADAVSARLKADGYTVSVEEAVPGARWVLLAMRSMVPLLSEMQLLRSKFDDFAAREGGMYDSWRAAPLA